MNCQLLTFTQWEILSSYVGIKNEKRQRAYVVTVCNQIWIAVYYILLDMGISTAKSTIIHSIPQSVVQISRIL